MTSQPTNNLTLIRISVLLVVLIIGSALGTQGAAADVLAPLQATGGSDATNDGSTASASADTSSGCTLLSAAVDTASLRRGYEVGYEEYPIQVILSCGSMEEAERALNLMQITTVADTSGEPIAVHGELAR